ncbi:hypothetical protein J6T21_03260 [Candidatus Saccharibacteria bacterium]|nr:hypothetical protein [Candidatus Saccharibacteria bacterium]
MLKRRVIHALLTHNFGQIEKIREADLLPDEEQRLYEKILESKITYDDLRNFLLYVGRPDEQGKSFSDIYFAITQDKGRMQLKVLETFVDNRVYKGVEALKEFIRIYPTRMDFEDVGREWLNHEIGVRRNELTTAMNGFLLNTYGEQDVYFRILKELYARAGEYGAQIDYVEINGGKDVNGDGMLDEILSGRIRMEDMNVWDGQTDEKAIIDARKQRMDKIWKRIVDANDARQLQIIAYLSGLGWDKYAEVDESAVEIILQKFPGRGMFENEGVKLLSLIRDTAQREKYSESMLALIGALYT